MKEISEETQRLLKTVYDDCRIEDSPVRERQIRQWRRLKLLWEGFQNVYYDEVAHDWRIWDQTNDQDFNQSSYDKPINVFKAYLESIIAALSISVPPIKCYPDDADNTLDLATARAGDKIAQLIYRHNDVPLLWLHALFIFCTESPVACYSYPKADDSYGTYEEKQYDEVEQENEQTICSNCGSILDESPIEGNSQQLDSSGSPNASLLSNKQLVNDEKDEYEPDDEDAQLHAALASSKQLCPSCMIEMDPEIKRNKFIVTRLVGTTTKPKSRICLEVYGGLYIKVSNYAKHQKDTSYLIFSQEIDYALAVEKYGHLRDNKYLLKQIKGGNQPGSYNQYDQWGRLSPQYQGEYPLNVVTENNAWIRSCKFNILPEEDAKKLKKLYPDGAKVVFVNDQFAYAENESLDDCWTLSENPLADFLYHDPLGQGLVSIQEITNDLISLVLQTIEHGIGQTFADPAVLNFKAYAQTETLPGSISSATPKSGKSLGDGFHELRTATLSSEVLPFSESIQSLGQLVSGALPSLFGGQTTGGGDTASQYSMSRAQALQRLQNTWKIFTIWWKVIFSKVVPMYIKEVKEDERDVQRDDDGNFINILIRKAELEGKIGKVELEANENLPMTWAQRKDLIEKLLTAGNPEILAILNAPENVGLIHESLGLVDFYVPGEDDIIKQYDEIKLLLNSTPLPTGNPQDPEEASIQIDPIYDNHAAEFEICRKWIISETGRQTKTDNEAGYRNVLLHGKMHYQMIQQAQMAQQQQANPAKPAQETQIPIQGEQNVQTIQ